MKKTASIFLSLLLLLALALLTACSGETKGVPESLVMEQLQKYDEDRDFDDFEIDIIHNVDKELHIDDVHITGREDGRYGSYSWVRELRFRYDKSTDTWEYDSTKGIHTEHSQKLDGAALVSGSPFRGTVEDHWPHDGYTYEITFYDVDFDAATALIGCTINGDYEYMEVALQKQDHAASYDFCVTYHKESILGEITSQECLFRLHYKVGVVGLYN